LGFSQILEYQLWSSGLMVLPTMIVGNELLILGGVALAVGAWCLAHRHGKLKGMVEAHKNAPPLSDD
jgi:hypothetical protein